MMPTLDRIISPLIERVAMEKKGGAIFGDLFAGSGSVGHYFKNHPHVGRVVASDMELYSYVINNALLKCVYTRKLSKIIAYLNGPYLRAGGVRGLVWKHFAPSRPECGDGGRRMFFTLDNARRIDAIRVALNRLHRRGAINYKEFLFLLASLMASCSRYANVASCFRAYLKKFSDRSRKKFMISPVHMERTRPSWKKNSVIKNNACKVARNEIVDIAYIDPPYNANHYGGYYSFYNYLAVYHQSYQISGVAGVTTHYNKSDFGFKASAKNALTKLIASLRPATKFIVMSYNSDGVLTKDEVLEILGTRGSVTLYKMWNKKFKPHVGVKDNIVKEYVFVADCRGAMGDVKEVWWEMTKSGLAYLKDPLVNELGGCNAETRK